VAGRDRQREDLLDETLRALERARRQVLDGRLLVARHGVVNAGRDAAFLQRLGEGIPL
jgi:hypothetical protein